MHENDEEISTVDATRLKRTENKILGDYLIDENYDHATFQSRIRQRYDQVGVELPKIEVRYENLSVKVDQHVGTRALPTLFNATLDFIEKVPMMVRLAPSKKRKHKILNDVSGAIRSSRMTLLLGPPNSGKTTFLLALAGKLHKGDLKLTGKITYNGHELNEFVPERTCAFVSQNDVHHGLMTVRETLDFSGKFLGIGSRYKLLEQVLEREKQQGFNKVDHEIHAFMKGVATKGQHTKLITEYLLKLLGLDTCADNIVGDDMRRGISGGEKKRLTIGEMLAGPAKVLLMDEISTGLDSSTTFQICKHISEMVHTMDMTSVISMLQPTPEVFELFDDVILLSDGQIVYQGPCNHVLNFFEHVGFKCPKRKGVADFLQEVTSKKDQQQYWFNNNDKQKPYKYVSIPEFVQAFKSFRSRLDTTSYPKVNTHPFALEKQRYGVSKMELFKTCFSREWLLMKRNALLHIFKNVQVTMTALFTMSAFFRTTMHHDNLGDGEKYVRAIFFSLTNMVLNGMAETTITIMGLPIFYKQRDFLFYPAWAYGLPIWILSIPSSFIESGLWTILTYYTIGYSSGFTRFLCQWLAFFCIHQMALSVFRLVSSLGRTIVIANTIGMIVLMFMFVLSGFVIAKGDLALWMVWAYYLSPMIYGQQALVANEFLDERWNIPNGVSKIHEETIGKFILASRGLSKHQYWFWISIGALLGFSILYNLLYIVALKILNPINNPKVLVDDKHGDQRKNKYPKNGTNVTTQCYSESFNSSMELDNTKGMYLPFKPLSVAFEHINYYVNSPPGMKKLGYEEDRFQLLQNVSGAFRPGVLTALLGITGAGKTTLLDVLAGQKSSGYIEGRISVSGYPKNQETFARICGYCEQIAILSPHLTVYESLLHSAWLRLSSNVDGVTQKMFIDEIIRLVELEPLRNAIVGLPSTNGLSIEQRKRLTIAVELVANPSIIFMDEPTSGLDARAAAIVMRIVRNIVNNGRTIVCTIHQPSIDIFEAFDELLLMKRGGKIIYAGSLGDHSNKLIEYFEAIPGVPKIKDGYNPATWVLDITSPQVESQLDLDFAEIYINSQLYQRNEEIIEQVSTPLPESEDLYFPTKHSQPFSVQFKACFWKQYRSYWQNPSFNNVRFYMTTIMGALLGIMFWNKGNKLTKLQDLEDLFGMMFSAILFLGGASALNVQSVVASERIVFYREKATRMYSALPFALAQLAIETIYIAVVNIVYCLLLFGMIGFEWTIGRFFYFYYFIFMCFTYYATFGMMLVSLTPREEMSAILFTFFATLWNLFAGFFLPRMQIPTWWRWFYWASPVSWTMYGLLTSQVGDKSSLLEVPEMGNVPLNIFLEEIFGYKYDFLPFVAVAHIGWVFLFSFIFAGGIKLFNFQKK